MKEKFFEKDLKKYVSVLKHIDKEQRKLKVFSPYLQNLLSKEDEIIISECKKLEEKIRDSGELLKTRQKFRENIWKLYSQSKFMDRALKKPNGHPGDYKIIQWIYDGKPTYDNEHLQNGIGLHLDKHFMSHPLADGVIERKNLMRKILEYEISNRNKQTKILNLGSGSLQEWFELLKNGKIEKDKIDLLGIDKDEKANNFSRQRLKDVKELAKINFVDGNMFEIGGIGDFDIVYSLGVDDYLSEKQLINSINQRCDLISPGGKTILTQKDIREYKSTTPYTWKSDWFFFPRTQEMIEEIYKKTKLADFKFCEKLKDKTKTITFYIFENQKD
jgi:extracellular factor (EF) 3-hydroxypalmitic acid methyl ester biosynthesis protein